MFTFGKAGATGRVLSSDCCKLTSGAGASDISYVTCYLATAFLIKLDISTLLSIVLLTAAGGSLIY